MKKFLVALVLGLGILGTVSVAFAPLTAAHAGGQNRCKTGGDC